MNFSNLFQTKAFNGLAVSVFAKRCSSIAVQAEVGIRKMKGGSALFSTEVVAYYNDAVWSHDWDNPVSDEHYYRMIEGVLYQFISEYEPYWDEPWVRDMVRWVVEQFKANFEVDVVLPIDPVEIVVDESAPDMLFSPAIEAPAEWVKKNEAVR